MLETKEFYQMARAGYEQVANKALAEMSSIDTLIKMMDEPTQRFPSPANAAAASNAKRRPGRPRKDTAAPTKIAAPRKRRKLTAAARKAISVAQKARWKAHRAAKK